MLRYVVGHKVRQARGYAGVHKVAARLREVAATERNGTGWRIGSALPGKG